ncbi:MAG TPA: glycosyltransferase family A protein [Dehalococcoidia bacterium]|nr:glycosyltransferase family A protein [Dehalococcoidia bacterium]
MPRVSVLVPCFNHGEFIDEAIDSVLAQTCQDFEIVIVDDGSTGDTREKLATYAHPRARVIRTENRGLPAARNTAARAGAGELLCALDADDRLAPTWLERALGVLDASPEVAFVSHWFETFGDEHWTWTPTRCDLPALLARNTINGAALVRRVAFEAVGGYDERMRNGCEDWDFWLRLVEHGFSGAIVPEVLFQYRRREASMSRSMTSGATYRAPLAALVAAHEGSYRAHAVEVLALKEQESLGLLREVHGLERDHLTGTLPALARAREELAALDAVVDRARAKIADAEELTRLRWKAGELEREVGELRRSWSWRAMAPARAVYGWLRRRRPW